MVGKYITIHKVTKYKGKDTLINSARLCNPYDPDSAVTSFNIEVTCKNCLRILKK